MRVHVLQIAYDDHEPVADRVTRVARMVTDQRGADLVVLPELWAAGGFSYRHWARRAEPVGGPTIRAISAAAAEIGAVVHAGSIVETVPATATAAQRGPTGRGLWNTSVLLGPHGGVLATYRKIHRFGFGAGEPALMEAGERIVAVPVPRSHDRWHGSGTDTTADPAPNEGSTARPGGTAGAGRISGAVSPCPDPAVCGECVVVGLATCYDLRFPEQFRLLLDAGARMVIVPAAWPATRVEHWQVLGRARAIENQLVVVQCNTGGCHAGIAMGGHSQVVSATGAVLAEAGDGEEVLVVDLDLDDVRTWRQQFPVLADRRLWPPAAG